MNATCIDAINRERIDNISEKFAHVRYFLYLCAKIWRKAHQENDRAVMAAYGFSTKMSESECVAELFKKYQKLARRDNAES